MDEQQVTQMKEQNETFRTKMKTQAAEIQRLTGELDTSDKKADSRATEYADKIKRVTDRNVELKAQLSAAKADLRDVFTKINNAVVEMIQKHQDK